MQLKQGFTLNKGKYRIAEILGQGNLGICYLAEHEITIEVDNDVLKTNIKVVIKEFFMKEHCCRDAHTSCVLVSPVGNKALIEENKLQFISKAQTVSELDHDHIIKVLEIFEENNTAYQVTEYIEGGSLEKYVAQCGALDEIEARCYIKQVAGALDYLHSKNINHLNIKPSNILIIEGGVAVLTDFGFTNQNYTETLTQENTAYIPLEQYINKEGFSFSTDIYSLGAVFYKLITANTPPHALEVYEQGLPTLPKDVSATASAIINAVMQPKRKDRPQNIKEFSEVLNGLVVTKKAREPKVFKERNSFKKQAKQKAQKWSKRIKVTMISAVSLIIGIFSKHKRLTDFVILFSLVSILLFIVFFNSGDRPFTRADYEALGSPSELTVPDKYTLIADSAFYSCSNLESVILPSSITSIGNDAFCYCDNLHSIRIPSSVTTIGNSAFYNCYNLLNIKLPNFITHIGNSVFYGCANLRSITLPQSLTSIEDFTFCYCSKLVSVDIFDEVTYIGNSAFCGCSQLMKITIPNSVTSIGLSAFYSCAWLNTVVIPNSVKRIEAYAFSRCTSLYDITIPNSVTSLGVGVFSNCSVLSDVTLSKSLTTISAKAFAWCTNLASITMHEGLTSIEEHAFSRCYKLRFLKLPNSLTSLGENSFYNCTSLSSITLPEFITSIGDYSFLGCEKLKKMIIPSSVISIGDGVFSYCPNLRSEHVDISGTNYILERGILYDREKTKVISSLQSEVKGSVNIPNSVTHIGGCAFLNCSNLESVTIPNSVTTMGEYAFTNCTSLKTITISEDNKLYNEVKALLEGRL
ncbi:MAG: leucine-rich repeat protein [Rikenellaceae bacterium]